MTEKYTRPFEILNRWKKHLNEEYLSGVLELYDLNCVLIPTFSSEILKNHEQIKEYFLKIIEIQKAKVEFNPNSISEQEVGENTFLLSGIYVFHLIEKEKISARFSFLVNLLNKNPIIHHHSSLNVSN